MKELEVKTYNFAIQGIGLIKSLKKEFPELADNDLRQSMGAVSIKFIDALNAEENEDFAKNIRDCHSNALKSSELLIKMDEIKNDTFNKQKETLINESKLIIEKLDTIISKLIF